MLGNLVFTLFLIGIQVKEAEYTGNTCDNEYAVLAVVVTLKVQNDEEKKKKRS